MIVYNGAEDAYPFAYERGDERCPGCGQVDPMGDEAAWHADACPVVDLDTVIGAWITDATDETAWTLTPHVVTLGGNVVGIEGTLADEYATRVLVTVADREPVTGHPGADPHPGYTVSVCREDDLAVGVPTHDHSADPEVTVDTPADVPAAIRRLTDHL